MARWIALLALGLACAGCELIADFDREKIPGQTTAGTSAPPRSGAGAPAPDGGTGADAGTDGGADAGDAGMDASTDSDAGSD